MGVKSKKLSFGFGGRVVEGTKVTSSRLATSHHGLSHASYVALVSSEHAREVEVSSVIN